MQLGLEHHRGVCFYLFIFLALLALLVLVLQQQHQKKKEKENIVGCYRSVVQSVGWCWHLIDPSSELCGERNESGALFAFCADFGALLTSARWGKTPSWSSALLPSLLFFSTFPFYPGVCGGPAYLGQLRLSTRLFIFIWLISTFFVCVCVCVCVCLWVAGSRAAQLLSWLLLCYQLVLIARRQYLFCWTPVLFCWLLLSDWVQLNCCWAEMVIQLEYCTGAMIIPIS